MFSKFCTFNDWTFFTITTFHMLMWCLKKWNMYTPACKCWDSGASKTGSILHVQLELPHLTFLGRISNCTCKTGVRSSNFLSARATHAIRSCKFHSARANLEHCTCERWLHVQRWTCWFVARAKQCAVIVARANGSLVDLLHVQLNIVARAIACPLHVQKLCAPAKTRARFARDDSIPNLHLSIYRQSQLITHDIHL